MTLRRIGAWGGFHLTKEVGAGGEGGEEQDGLRKQQQQRLPRGQLSLESGTASGLAFFILLQPGGDLYHAGELPPPFTHLSIPSVVPSLPEKALLPV